MAQVLLLLSTLLGLAFIAAIALLSGRGWHHYSLALPGGGSFSREDQQSVFARVAGHPTTWTLAFVFGAVVLGGGAVLFVSGAAIPETVQQLAGIVLVGGFALIFVLYLFYGTFVSARNRGMPNSMAAAFGSWAIALLFLVVVVLKLVGVF